MKKKFKKQRQNLKRDRSIIKTLFKYGNKKSIKRREYKVNKLIKIPGRPDLRIDTITEVYLSVEEARKRGFFKFKSESDDEDVEMNS